MKVKINCYFVVMSFNDTFSNKTRILEITGMFIVYFLLCE